MNRNFRISKKNSPPITGKCDICGEMTYLPFKCKRCLGIFCDKHHFPENHSCVPISKIIKEFKQYEEFNLPKTEEEKIKNKIDEIKRIIVTLKSMYESREMGQNEYFDKITSFNREKEELEAKLGQLQNIGANNEEDKTSVKKNDKALDNSGHPDTSENYYIVDEKYKREYIGDINKANYSPVVNNIEKEGKHDQIRIKNRCDQCGLPITGIPFKCRRCGLSFCMKHRLPEYHFCAIRKEYSTNGFIEKTNYFLKSRYNQVKNWLNRRNYRRYRNWNAFFMNFIGVVILSISFLIIYSNIEKLNEINIWLIPLGSAFIFVNGILWVKKTYKFLKLLNYWFKGERNLEPV